jgi:competence protein ComEA
VTGSDSPGARIVVHVTGAVARSGVYQLPPGSRTVDAVEAAGGAAPGANTDALNMAAPVADGDQVVVPRRAAVSVGAPPSRSPEAYAASNAASGSQSAKLTTPGEGTVNINTASSDELQRLPGIGPAMAARILTHRKAIGRFTAVEQLMDVGGIGEKKLGHMKPFVRLR